MAITKFSKKSLLNECTELFWSVIQNPIKFYYVVYSFSDFLLIKLAEK